MAEVTVFTAEHTQEIYDATVTDGEVDGSGHLILTTHGGSDIDAGLVRGIDGVDGTDGADGSDGADGAPGPPASIGATPPSSPVTGQVWYDTSNLTGLTDLMAGANPASSTANWVALGFGYDTGITFSVAGGGVTCTWTTTGNHAAGIPLGSLVPGNSYLVLAKLRVPVGSPDVNVVVPFKTSGVKTTVKGVDVQISLAFTVDATGAYFGIESGGATGTAIVKELKVYALNQKGFPCYIWDGSTWVMQVDLSTKGDQYSRVNTYGAQTVNGDKTWTGSQVIAPATDISPLIIKRGADPGGAASKLLDIQNHAGSTLAYVDYNGILVAAGISTGALVTSGEAQLDRLKVVKCIDISSTNLDSLTVGGYYDGVGMTNAPGSGYYYIENIVSNSGTNYILQRATERSTTPRVFVRERVSGTWNAWRMTSTETPAVANGYQGSNATAASTTFAPLSPGLEVSFVAPYSGTVYIIIFCDISMSGTAAGVGSYEIRTAASGGGSVFFAADDTRSCLFAGAASRVAASGPPVYLTGLTPGTTYYARTMGRNGTGTGAATFNVRRIYVEPR